MQPLPQRVVAEALGTAMLLAAVVGSGIMGERLASGNEAVALLANTIATGAALVALILTFGPISGAHINPVVTFASALQRNRNVAAVAPRNCATINPGTFAGWIPVNVSVSDRASVTAGFANDVEDVNQYAAVM